MLILCNTLVWIQNFVPTQHLNDVINNFQKDFNKNAFFCTKNIRKSFFLRYIDE